MVLFTSLRDPMLKNAFVQNSGIITQGPWWQKGTRCHVAFVYIDRAQSEQQLSLLHDRDFGSPFNLVNSKTRNAVLNAKNVFSVANRFLFETLIWSLMSLSFCLWDWMPAWTKLLAVCVTLVTKDLVDWRMLMSLWRCRVSSVSEEKRTPEKLPSGKHWVWMRQFWATPAGHHQFRGWWWGPAWLGSISMQRIGILCILKLCLFGLFAKTIGDERAKTNANSRIRIM